MGERPALARWAGLAIAISMNFEAAEWGWMSPEQRQAPSWARAGLTDEVVGTCLDGDSRQASWKGMLPWRQSGVTESWAWLVSMQEILGGGERVENQGPQGLIYSTWRLRVRGHRNDRTAWKQAVP